MRLVPMLLLALVSIPKPVNACLGPFAETSIFSKSIPPSILQSEALLKVSLISVGAKKKVIVIKTIKDPTGNIRPGSKIELDYGDSSCGPNHRFGESGFIRVKISGKGNQTKFYPYLYPRIQK